MSSVLEHSEVEAKIEPEESPYLFRTDEFYRLLETEFFPREARVGLWDGRIYEKMSKTQAHSIAGNKVNRFLVRALPDGWFVGGENPVTVSPTRAPLPDLVILRGEPDDYKKGYPTATDVGLIVELSVSSLKFDQGTKLAAYASAGMPAYWVLNLVDNVILVSSEPIPSESRYATMATFKPGDFFPLILDGIQIAMIAASDLLPVR
jgi:Uma2 family endonuclease